MFVISGAAVLVAAAVAVLAFFVGYERGFERCRREMNFGFSRANALAQQGPTTGDD